MHVGLRNPGQTLQRTIDSVVQGLDGIFYYIDNILIAILSEEMHRLHLEALFNWLRENSLIVRPEKWKFGCPELDFLDCSMDTSGIHPLPGHIDSISKVYGRRSSTLLERDVSLFPGGLRTSHPGTLVNHVAAPLVDDGISR